MTTPKELVESQFPNYFLEQYPQFVKFVEEYYSFLESSIVTLTDSKKLSEGDVLYGSLSKAKAVVKNIAGNRVYFDYETKINEFYKNEVIVNGDTGEIYFIRNLYKNIYQYMKDIEQNSAYETTLNIFKKYFKKNVSLDHSIFRKVDPKTLTQRILDYYKNKSSENSYYWFFRIFFDEDIELYYPKVDILKLSDSGYYEKNLVQIDLQRSHGNFSNARVYAKKSKASAICKNSIINFKDNSKRGFLDLIFINGTFESNEEVIAYDMSTGEEIGRTYIIDSIIGVNVTDGGIGHKVGDRFMFDDGVGEVSKLKKHSITNINILNPGIAYRVGDPIVFDNAFTGSTYTANAYVAEINVNPTLSKYFNDYYNLVKNRPVEFYKGKSLINEVFAGSGTFQNTTPQLILPLSISSDYEVGSIKSIRFENSGLGYDIPPRTSALNPLGQASLLNYFDLTFKEDDANAQFIVANTVVNFSGGTNIPSDENEGVCVGEVQIDNDKHEILLEGLPFKSEDFVVKRFVTQRSVSNLEDDSKIDFEYDNGTQIVTLESEIIDLLDYGTLNDTAELEAVLGNGIAEVKLNQIGLMVNSGDPIKFQRNPEDFEYNEPEIAHGLLSELEYKTSLMFEPFGDFLDNKSKLSSDKYIFDNHYYQHYSYEIRTKIPASLIEPLLLDELHPAGFLAFIRNKFEEELDLRIKTVELPEIEVESQGYLTSEVYSFVKVQIEKFGDLTVADILQKEIESEFVHYEKIHTNDYHEIEVDGIADIFEGFKYFVDDIIVKPVDNSMFDLDNYLRDDIKSNIINTTACYDGIVAVESFMKIINVEDEANWIADVIGKKVGPIGSMRDETINNFRITNSIIREFVTSNNKGGIILVRDASLDYDGYLLSSDGEQFSNTNIQFSDSYDKEFLPVLSGNALNERGSYLPDSQILTKDFGWVKFKDLKIGTEVANVNADGTIEWVVPREVVKTQYSGTLYQYTDNDKISITVTPYQELVISDEKDNLSKIKSEKLNIQRTPHYFYIANQSNAYLNKSVLEEKLRIKNNIFKYKHTFSGELYCVMIDEFEYENKMPSTFGEPDLDLVHMVSAINNEYTIPKLKTIEEVVHNHDFLEGIKLDFSFMQTIQPPSNTIIFDFNSNVNVINPYPEVAPTEVFFFSSVAQQADSQTLGPEPSIVVDLARINPLALEHIIIAKPEVGLDTTQQEYFSFGDYGQYFQFVGTERPKNITNLIVDMSEYTDDRVDNALILEGSGIVEPEVIYDVPLHTVINADNQNLTITIMSSKELGETQIGKIINEDKDTCDFRIERYADDPKNKSTILSFSNAISSLKEGDKPKTGSQIQLLQITLNMAVIATIGEISNVLCPDHQFDPKGIVTILNKFDDKQKNRVAALISAAHADAFADRDGLGVLFEQGDIINWHHVTELIPKDPDVRYLIKREYKLDQTVGDPIVAYFTHGEESVYGYGLKNQYYMDSIDYGYDSTDILFDYNNVYKNRRNTIFDKTVFNAKLEVPSVLNYFHIKTLVPQSDEDHELQYLQYVSAPFQIRSTEEDDLIPINFANFGSERTLLDDVTTFDSTVYDFADDLFVTSSYNYVDKRAFNIIRLPVIDTKETFFATPFNTTPYLLYIDLSFNSNNIAAKDDSGADAISTLSLSTEVQGSNLSALETDAYQTSFVPILDRFLFFDYNERIRDWYNIYFKPYIKAVQRTWMGDLLPSVKALYEPYIHLKPIKEELPLLNQIDSIIYFPNTTFLSGESALTETHNKIQYSFDVESRKRYIDIGDKIKPWVNVEIKDYFKGKFRYIGDTMPFIDVKPFIDIETLNETKPYTNPTVNINSTVYYPNTIFLSAASDLEHYESKVIVDKSILDRNTLFDLSDEIVAKVIYSEIEKRHLSKKLTYYDKDTLPSLFVEGDTNIEMFRTIFGSTPMFADPLTIVYYPNTTFMSAESVVDDYESKIKRDTVIIDRNSIFNIRDRKIYGKFLGFEIEDKYFNRRLTNTRDNTIPRMTVDGMADIEAYRDVNDEALSNMTKETIVYFPNTVFLDATSFMFENNELEMDDTILNKNFTFSLNNQISKWNNREIEEYVYKQKLLTWDGNALPSPYLKYEPTYISKSFIDLSASADNLTTVVFANTTFLDATPTVEKYMEFDFEQMNFENESYIFNKDTVLPLADKPIGTKWYYKEIENKDMKMKISDFADNYMPAGSVFPEPYYIHKTFLDSSAGVDSHVTVTFANTTFLDASASIEKYLLQDFEQVNLEYERKFLDKNIVIGLDEKIFGTRLFYKPLIDDILDKPIIPSSKEYIPSVSIHNEPNYISKAFLDSSAGVDSHVTITFANTTFLDATGVVTKYLLQDYEQMNFENLNEFLDRNKVVGLNDRIGGTHIFYDKLDWEVLNTPIVPSSSNYIPSVSIHNEPNFISKAFVDSSAGADSHITVTFANTTFLEASATIEKYMEQDFEQVNFEYQREFGSDYKKITKDTMFVKKYNEKIDNFLNYKIAENYKDILRIANSFEEHNFINKSSVDSTTGVDNHTTITFANTTFLDATTNISDYELKLSKLNISYTDEVAISVSDRIDDKFMHTQIHEKLSVKIVDDSINIRPALSSHFEYQMSHVSDDSDLEILKPETYIESSYDRTSNEYAGSSEEPYNRTVRKILNEVNNRNIYFDTDKMIEDYIMNQIIQWEKFKVSDYLGDKIPSAKIDVLSNYIFEPVYNIREFTRGNKLIKTDFAKTVTSVNYEDTVLSMNDFFGVANTHGYVNTTGVVDGLGFEINNINNGITLQEFLLNNYVDNYLNDVIKDYDDRHVKRRNDYRRYNRSSLRMNYIKNESYTWNISALNTFATNYNDPNINRSNYIDSVRIEI